MRFKFTLFLFILNVIAFGLIIYLNSRATRTEVVNGGLSTLIGREIVEADRIELRGQSLDQPRILKKQGSTWSITEPMQWSANYFAVNRILNQLQFLEEETAFSVDEIERSGQSLSDYGLEDPLISLTVAHQDESMTLSVGTLTEIGNNVYLLSPDDEEIYVVNRKVIDSLLVDLADLRTRDIFEIPVFEVDALGLQIKTSTGGTNGDLKVRLARTKDGWLFEAPLTAVADPTLVSNTINTLSAAKVARFVEVSDPTQGLDSPSMRITLNGNKRRQTLLIGNIDPNSPEANPTYFARLEDNPTVFTVDAKPLDDLRRAQEALRERNFMSFDAETLNSVVLLEGEKQIRLQKLETGSWQVIESDESLDIQPYRADTKIIDRLIDDIRGMRASGFALDRPSAVDIERLGFTTPRRKVVLSFNGQPDLTLELAHPESENSKLYARNDRGDFIYEVERRSTLRKLPLNHLYYRARVLENLPGGAKVVGLKLENLVTGEIYFDRKLGSLDALWVNALDDLKVEEQEAIIELVNTVRSFEVRSYLKDGYEEPYQLDREKEIPWSYRLTAEKLLAGGETSLEDQRVYVFTERLSGSVQVGGSEFHESIFELLQPTLEALYVFTDTIELSPEAKGEPVIPPVRVDPLPEPTPVVLESSGEVEVDASEETNAK